jgi:hypothetical protein
MAFIEPHSIKRAGYELTSLVGLLLMKTEKVGHHEGWRTLWLAIAGVMAITLTWNVLMLSLNGISY